MLQVIRRAVNRLIPRPAGVETTDRTGSRRSMLRKMPTKIGTIVGCVSCIILLAMSWRGTMMLNGDIARTQLLGAMRVLEGLVAEAGSGLSVREGNLVIGERYVLNDSTDIVDRVYALTGCNAAFFLGEKSVSTSVKTKGGERAAGATADPVVVDYVIRKGREYWGVADVAGTRYLAYYRPIRGEDRSVIGMLLVGAPLEELGGAASGGMRRFLLPVVLGAVVTAGITALVVGRLVGHVGRISELAAAVAAGNLTVDVPAIRTGDEVQELGSSFQGMIESLRAMIAEVSTVSEKVSSASQEISAAAESSSEAIQQVAKAAQDMARNTERQAGEVAGADRSMKSLRETLSQVAQGSQHQAELTTRTSASVKEIDASIRDVSRSTESLARVSEDTRKKAASGKDAVHCTAEGMQAIGAFTSEMGKSIEMLAARSDKI
ncbi:MAG: methyl-accepting chemotaxis protein, partial [Firmicutes bacterium]|nr:methyl-accepting chemotaxis protein [Bacillota bacterium]